MVEVPDPVRGADSADCANPLAPRALRGSALAQALRDSRARTWALVDDLTDGQWQVPEQRGVNPIAWELGHLAWFAEYWILRGPHTRDADGFGVASRPPRHAGPDARFDSSRLAHAARWRTLMPSRAELVDMLAAQLDACLAALPAVAVRVDDRGRRSRDDRVRDRTGCGPDRHHCAGGLGVAQRVRAPTRAAAAARDGGAGAGARRPQSVAATRRCAPGSGAGTQHGAGLIAAASISRQRLRNRRETAAASRVKPVIGVPLCSSVVRDRIPRPR